MAEKKTYAGKIKNGGNQVVEPIYKNDTKPTGKVVRGTDLRTGRKSGK